MDKAAAIVAMGGYNTFCEILSLDKRALIVPRTRPRLEQYIRAVEAERLGLVRMLSEDARQPRPGADGGGAARAAEPAAAVARCRPGPARRARPASSARFAKLSTSPEPSQPIHAGGRIERRMPAPDGARDGSPSS